LGDVLALPGMTGNSLLLSLKMRYNSLGPLG